MHAAFYRVKCKASCQENGFYWTLRLSSDSLANNSASSSLCKVIFSKEHCLTTLWQNQIYLGTVHKSVLKLVSRTLDWFWSLSETVLQSNENTINTMKSFMFFLCRCQKTYTFIPISKVCIIRVGIIAFLVP